MAQWERIRLPTQEMWVWISELERPPGVGNGNPLQYSCLENPSPWRCKESDMTEHACARARTHTHTHTHTNTHTHNAGNIFFLFTFRNSVTAWCKLAAHYIYWKNESINERRKESYQIIGIIKCKVCPVQFALLLLT